MNKLIAILMVICLSVFSAPKTNSSFMNISKYLKKIAKKNVIHTPTTIAGIRGSERGQRGTFGVNWSGGNAQRENTYDKAVIYFDKGNYDGALIGFGIVISLNKAPLERIITAREYVAVCYAEMESFTLALKTIEGAMELDLSEESRQQFLYMKALYLNSKEEYKESIKIAKEVTHENVVWSAKLLNIINYIQLRKLREARKLKDDILINCKDKSILKAVSAINI